MAQPVLVSAGSLAIRPAMSDTLCNALIGIPSGLGGAVVPGIVWPPLPTDVLGILAALRATEALTEHEIQAGQLRQLCALAEHARTHTSWGRQHLPEVLSWEAFQGLPVLDRQYVQAHEDELRAEYVPAEHGHTYPAMTSGSTGTPVQVWKSVLAGAVWTAVNIRDHQWHQRDLSLTLAAIRRAPDAAYPGMYCSTWGYASDVLGGTGQCWLLDVGVPAHEQIAWLVEHSDFAYLLTFPSNLSELLRVCEERGQHWPFLREVRTVSEPVSEELRARCRHVFGVEIVDMYSTQELGYLALQRPDGPGYYVMSDTHVVEVLGDDGSSCRPGEIGRVVVTALHNFAMPLFRYDVGDLALVGEPGALPFPVLERVFGRSRNLLLAPDGTRRWPSLGTLVLMKIAPVVQHQFVQVARDRIVVRLVVGRAVTSEEEHAMRMHLQSRNPEGIHFEFIYVDDIPRGAGGKFEDFISEVS